MQKRNVQSKARVLIVDDEFHVARGAAMVLSQAGYECETCPTVEAALKVLEHSGADVIVADMRMPGMDGMDLLKKVQSKDPDVSVVLSMPLPAAESAKEALRGGAFDCVTKPFDNDELECRRHAGGRDERAATREPQAARAARRRQHRRRLHR